MSRGVCGKLTVACLFALVGLNAVFLFRRSASPEDCDLEALIYSVQRQSAVEMKTDRKDSDRIVDDVNLTADIDCAPNVPCEYPEVVDLRIIILTYDRADSLLRLLNSINDLYLDGDSCAVEIWVDRAESTGEANVRVVATARSFQWRHGSVRVHVHRTHVGIYGQWIDTWRPRLDEAGSETKEIALILEDDISVSPHAYRWLKAARRFYAQRTDVAGMTLQSEGLIYATSGRQFTTPSSGVAYFYMLMGSWGFSPRPAAWRGFQDWYHRAAKNSKFRPYVDGLVMTQWYKSFEGRGTAASMWTMWFIHYCSVNRLYTLYNNLNKYRKRGDSCLAVNRREPGLHFQGRAANNTALLLQEWSSEFVRFDAEAVKLNFEGKPVKR